MSVIYEMYRGDNFSLPYTVTDPSIQATTADPYANRVDLTGCTIWFTAKTDTSLPDGSATFQKKTGGSGVTIATQSGGTKGQFTVTLSPTDTSPLNTTTELYFDCQIKDSAGEVYTLEAGLLRVLADVTISTT